MLNISVGATKNARNVGPEVNIIPGMSSELQSFSSRAQPPSTRIILISAQHGNIIVLSQVNVILI